MAENEGVGAEDLENALKVDEGNLPPEVEKEGAVEPKEKTPEELAAEHQESSKLGRKYKYLEGVVDDIKESVNTLVSLQTTRPVEQEAELDDDIPMTRRELEVYMGKRDKERDDLVKNYNREYLLELGRLTKDMTDEEAETVLGILEQSHNNQSHVDPLIAAGLNLRDSRIEYLSGKKTEKIVPLSPGGNRTGLASGVTGGEREQATQKDLPDLDDSAKAFLGKSNMSDKDIKDALENDSPTLKRG